MNKFFATTIFYLVSLAVYAQNPTWAKEIAPIIFENCASCHQAGAIAPFELMSYEDVVAYSFDIHHVIEERSMPPWPADPNYRHFKDEAYLAQEEIDVIHEWIMNGMPFGDPSIEPDPPVFSNYGSQLQQIDFSIAIEPYVLQYDDDEYRWFVIENTFDQDIYIKRIEVIPGLDAIVHHADLFLDYSQQSLNNDLADSLSGFNNDTGVPNNDHYINAWQPGANIITYPENWSFKISPGANFVVEIHFGPGGKGQIDSTKMNFELYQNPEETRALKASWLLTDNAPVLLDGPLVIPANEVVSFHQATAPLTNDLSLIAICPHMHFLGKSYKVWYEDPYGDSIPLINIPHWDFHWQKYYVFQEIQKIPKGSIIKSEGYYDNTLNNHDNPNNPPITVNRGLRTDDEMFLCYFIFTDYQEGDEFIVLDSSLLTTSTRSEVNFQKVGLYPNPAFNVLYWKNHFQGASYLNISIKTINGQSLINIEKDPQEKIHSIDISKIPEGIYLLSWNNGIQIGTTKFVKINQ